MSTFNTDCMLRMQVMHISITAPSSLASVCRLSMIMQVMCCNTTHCLHPLLRTSTMGEDVERMSWEDASVFTSIITHQHPSLESLAPTSMHIANDIQLRGDMNTITVFTIHPFPLIHHLCNTSVINRCTHNHPLPSFHHHHMTRD